MTAGQNRAWIDERRPPTYVTFPGSAHTCQNWVQSKCEVGYLRMSSCTHVVCQTLEPDLGEDQAVGIPCLPLERRPDELARDACPQPTR